MKNHINVNKGKAFPLEPLHDNAESTIEDRKEIPRMLIMLNNATERLGKALSRLEEKVVPVSVARPLACPACPPIPETASQLATLIKTEVEAVSSIITRIETMIESIEL
jgi:hypothetical protein